MTPRPASRSSHVALLAAVSALALAACASSPPPEATGRATLTLGVAPPDARCLVIQVSGTTQVTRRIDLVPAENTTYRLDGLPLGAVTFQADVYQVACAAVAGQVAAWTSDPVAATVTAGADVVVTLVLRSALGTGGAVVIISFPDAGPATQVEFPIPPSPGGVQPMPTWITSGPDGNLWFIEQRKVQVGRLTPAGALTEFQLPASPSPTGALAGIAAGTDGSLWITRSDDMAVVRMKPDGTFATFTLPPGAGIIPTRIVAGSDGSMWFTGSLGDPVGTLNRITPALQFTSFPAPGGVKPYDLAMGLDGNLWFTAASSIGRMTLAGTYLPAFPTKDIASSIVTGSDGAIWYGLDQLASIGRMAADGAETVYPTLAPTGNIEVADLVSGPDGNIWYTLFTQGRIGRMTLDGKVTEWPTGTSGSAPLGIAAGPDGNVWFAELNANQVGRILVP